MSRHQYEYWTKLEGKTQMLRRDAAIVAIEEAIPIMRDSISHNVMMVRAIFAVKAACYSQDEAFRKAIAEKFKEIDKLILKLPRD